MNNIHNDRAVANSSFHPLADKYSSFKNRNKRAVVAPLENIAKQLESVAILTNALILTEAVRSENTSIGKIMIDSLMIAQMPEDIDWIETLGSAKLDAAKVGKFNELITRMKSLRDVFDREESVDVPIRLMDKLNPEALQSFTKNADVFLNLLKMDSSILRSISEVKMSMRSLIMLPYTVKAMTKSKDFSELGDLVKAVKFIEKTRKLNVHKLLQESIEKCNISDLNDNKNEAILENCLSNLQKSTNSITEPISSLENATMAFNFLRVVSHISAIKNLAEMKEKTSGIMKKLENVAPLLAEMKNLANDDKRKKTFQEVISDLNTLKNSSQELKLLKKSLDWFIPLAQAVEEMTNLYKTGNVNSSMSSDKLGFLNEFKSYKCLSNGADSINTLKNVLGSSQSLSREYIMSGIVARLPVMEEYLSIYNRIIQHSAGLKAVEGLSKGISELIANSNPIKPISISGTFDEIVEFIPDLTNIEKSLGLVVTHIEALEQVNDWKTDLQSLNKSLVFDDAQFDFLTDLFLIIPEYVEFLSNLNSSLGNFNVIKSDHSVLKSYYEKIKNDIVGLPDFVHIAKRIGEIPQKNVVDLQLVEGRIPEIKDSLEKGKQFKVSKLKITEDVDLKAALNNIEKMSSILLVFEKITSKSSEIQKLADEIIDTNIFSKSSKLITNEDVKSMELMLSGMKGIRKTKKSMTESYQISKLMEGNPFGNEVLDNMYRGINDYRMIAKKVGSLKSVHDAIDQLEDGNKELMADIRKFLEGVEVMELIPAEDVINVYDVIMNIPSINSNLEKVENWMRIRNVDDKKTIEKQLNDLKSNDSRMIQQISMIHLFVFKIDQKFADNISKLRKGFKMFQEKITYVDCKKDPEYPRCHNVTESSENLKKSITVGHETSSGSEGKTIFIIVLSLVVFFVGLILLMYFWRSAAKRKKRFSSIQNFQTDFAVFRVAKYNKVENTWNLMIFFEFLSLEKKTRNLAEGMIENMCSYPRHGLHKKNRVKLNSEVNGVIRVHASHIQMHKRKWIVGQAPLPRDNCNEALFEMVLQENVQVIVRCRLFDEEDDTYCASGKYGRYEVTKTIVDESLPIKHCTLRVVDKEKNIDVTIVHLQLVIWLDNGTTNDDSVNVVNLMEKVLEQSDKGVVLVHCEDGRSQSMTFVSMVQMTDMLTDGKKVIIRDVVNDLRKQRFGAVTNTTYYGFLIVLMAKVCTRSGSEEEIKKYKRVVTMFGTNGKEAENKFW